MSQKLEITPGSFSKILVLVTILGFLYLIRDIVLLLFIAVIIASALQPIVDILEEENVPRWLAIIFIFLSVFFVLGVFVGAVLPPLISQGQSLLNSLPEFIQSSLATLRLDELVSQQEIRRFAQDLITSFSGDIAGAPANIIRFGAGVFGQVLTAFTLLVFTFYFMLERERVQNFVLDFFKGNHRKNIAKVIARVEEKLGLWLRGQLVLMILIGLLTYLGLTALQVDFALPLALFAGLLEIIPILGPLVSVVPALIVAAAISPLKALSVAIFYLLLQQLEGNVLVPRIMKEVVGLDPIVVILALMIGARLAGPTGALVSVPVSAVLMIVYQEWCKD